MVKRCVNPECRNEFRHLNMGDLFALESGSADTRFVWLCADCALKFTAEIDTAGVVSVQPRCDGMRTKPHDSRTILRLISAHRQHSPWHRAGLSGPNLPVGGPACFDHGVRGSSMSFKTIQAPPPLLRSGQKENTPCQPA
jgi:hypothetical protein